MRYGFLFQLFAKNKINNSPIIHGMKTLLLVTVEYAPDVGGIARYYSGLARALGKDCITVLAHSRNGNSQYNPQSDDEDVIRAPLLAEGGFFRWRLMLKQVQGVLQKTPAHYLAVGQVLPIGYVALILRWLKRQRYILFIHGMDILQTRNVWRHRVITQMILQHADLIIANSQATSKVVKSLYRVNQERMMVLHPGVALPNEIIQDDTVCHPIALSVGRFVARKGFDIMIQAMPLILQHVPDAQYIIIGDGKDRYRLVELARTTWYTDANIGSLMNLLESDRVVFLGAVSDDELAKWYQRCTVFVLPAREEPDDMEGFGMVYGEAASYAKPVVAGNSGGAGEAIHHQYTGLLVDPYSAEAVADAVVRLMTDVEYATRLGRAGREMVEREFQWSSRARELLARLRDGMGSSAE